MRLSDKPSVWLVVRTVALLVSSQIGIKSLPGLCLEDALMVSLGSSNLKNIRFVKHACFLEDCSILTLFCIRWTAVFCTSRLRISVNLLTCFAVCTLSPSCLFPLCFAFNLLYWSLAVSFCLSVLGLMKFLGNWSVVVNCATYKSPQL